MEKKLYRSEKETKIAGVCGGLSEYFGIDPVLFRILFVLTVLFGGIGLLAYLLLWVMVPVRGDKETSPLAGRRLFLSQKDRKIAGVCGGLGEFFQLDAVLFRVLFILAALVGGLGLFLYVVLWLVIPRHPESEAPGMVETAHSATDEDAEPPKKPSPAE